MARRVSIIAVHLLVALALWVPAVAAQQRGRGAAGDVENPTTINAITTENRDGTTVVIIIADDEFKPFGWRHYEIAGDEPRAVLRVRGIVRAFDADVLSVHGPLLKRIRIGHHPDHLPPELHLVFDLASPHVTIRGVEAKGKRLEVTLALDVAGRTPPPSADPEIAATPAGAAAPSSPTVTASPTPAPTATVAPTATPTFPPTQPPSPTATATAPPLAPTPRPTEPPLPLPPGTPTPFPGAVSETATSPTTTQAVTPPTAPAIPATPPPTRPTTRRPATTARLVEVEPRVHADGTAVVRIVLSEAVRYERYRLIEISDDPPRAVLSLYGVEAADLPRVTRLDRGGIESIRVVAAPDGGRDVHVVLSFSSPASTVRAIVVRDTALELQVGSPPR